MKTRTVKPAYFTHPEILQLSVPARLLLIALLGQADDEGKLYDNPQKIRGNAFGPDDPVNIEALMLELEEHGRILRYEASERRCVYVLKFTTHQTIPPSKRQGSTIPRPPKPLLEVYDPAAVAQLFSSNGAAKPDPPNLLHRDLFEAIAGVCGYDTKTMTDSEKGRTGRAAKELAKLGEQPEEVEGFAKDWVKAHPEPEFAIISPQVITNHWSEYCTGRLEKAGKRGRR